MLQNRKLNIVFVWLIIAITISEQQQWNQGQSQGHKSTRQPQMRQLEHRIIIEREQKAREMLKYMNSEADICKDFYNFACGNWLPEQNTDLASDGDLINVQGKMEQFVNKQLQGALREPTTSLDSMETKMAKDFYRSCLRVPASSPAQRQFILSFVENYGGLPDIRRTNWQPNYNWVNVVADLRRKYGFDILIGLTVVKTITNQKQIFIEEPKTTLLPVELCSSLATRQIDEKDQVFDKIQEDVKENLKSWFELNESNALRIAGAIIRFEFDLCKYMRIEQTSSIPVDNEREQLNLKMVENKIHGTKTNVANSPQSLHILSDTYNIHFSHFVQLIFDTAPSQVYFRSEKYFHQLSVIAGKGLQASFANYIMYRALSEINFPLNERRGHRPFYCTNQIMRYLPQALGKLYNEKFHNKEAKQDVEQIFFNIKHAFSKYLKKEVNWMSGDTKSAIIQKLFTIKITYPSYPHDEDAVRGLPELDNTDYWRKLQNIMMYNANQIGLQFRLTNEHSNFIEAPAVAIKRKHLTNELVMGFGLLQKPFYYQFYSNALKYSSVGVAIAREIIKLFDDQGLQQNFINNSPWNHKTMANFSLISECFRTQISNNFHNNPQIFLNATKVREIMVETSAVNIAFNAYISWLELQVKENNELRLETLPDVNFTNTQLFFINFAQTHCSARKNIELPPEFLPLYRRTMEQYDINGPLSNNVEFSRDFNCELGSDMNLDNKCLLY